MSIYHWTSALVLAAGIHILLIICLFYVESNDSPPVFETTGQGISINLSTYSLPAQPSATQATQQAIIKASTPTQKPDNPAINTSLKPIEKSRQTPKKKTTVSPLPKKTVTAKKDNHIPVTKTSEKIPTKPIEPLSFVEKTPTISDAKPSTPVHDLNIAEPSNTPNHSQSKATETSSSTQASGQQSKASNEYFNLIVQKLVRYKKYPLSARRKKQEGTVTIEFTVSKSGAIIQKKIKQSSGFSKLDTAVLKMLRRANPLPPIPDSIQTTLSEDSLTLVIPVNFALN